MDFIIYVDILETYVMEIWMLTYHYIFNRKIWKQT